METVVDRNTVYNPIVKPEIDASKLHTIKLMPILDNQAVNRSCEERAQRTLSKDGVIKMGRSEQSYIDAKPIMYKSKVVSRVHAELVLREGKWFVRDAGSSSGTYLNNERLNWTCDDERDIVPLHSGDVLRLGADFKGGLLPQYRAVRLYVLLDNGADIEKSEFLNSQLEKLKGVTNEENSDSMEKCALCLDEMKTSDGLFMSPCGHLWHYRCIQEPLSRTYPYFTCLLCRKASFLDEVDDEPMA